MKYQVSLESEIASYEHQIYKTRIKEAMLKLDLIQVQMSVDYSEDAIQETFNECENEINGGW